MVRCLVDQMLPTIISNRRNMQGEDIAWQYENIHAIHGAAWIVMEMEIEMVTFVRNQ